MNYTISSITFRSCDEKNTIHGRIYTPISGEIRGVVQLSHGMVDHTGRYEALADYLTKNGYVFAGNDHLGHGKSVSDDADFGFFAEKGGVDLVLRDLHAMNRILREKFPGVKPVIMGHSMGSFLSRLYVEKYPHTVSGHIIHGTGGPMGIILPLGKALVKTISLFRGKRYRSSFVKGIAFAYYDLFTAVGSSNSKKWFASYPTDLPTLIMSGDMDPVGNYGNGPKYVYKHLLVRGVTDLSLKLYEGARHELFNETNRESIFADMTEWLSGIYK